MRLPEVEHYNTVKSVDQLGRAPATGISTALDEGLRSVRHWHKRFGFWVLYGFLLSWYVD